MFKGYCRFRGGEMSVIFTPRKTVGLKPRLWGNKYRGLLIILGIVLLVFDLLLIAWIALTLAVIWSLIAVGRRQWPVLMIRNRMLHSVRKGQSGEWETDDPVLLWQFIGAALARECWEEAEARLGQLPEGPERDYWLVVTYLGKKEYARALRLCPARPDASWMSLKIHCLYKLGNGSQLLAALRAARRLKDVDKDTEAEWLYIRGAGYFLLGDARPARNLLRTIIKKHGPDYGQAANMLADIEGW